MTFKIETTEFLLHCRFEKNLSPKTLKAYETDLSQLRLFLNKKELVSEISKEDIRSYLVLLSSLKPKSIKRKIATMKALFNFLEFEDKILVNPFRKMRIKIKEPQTLRSVMDIREVIKILKTGYLKRDVIECRLFFELETTTNN